MDATVGFAYGWKGIALGETFRQLDTIVSGRILIVLFLNDTPEVETHGRRLKPSHCVPISQR